MSYNIFVLKNGNIKNMFDIFKNKKYDFAGNIPLDAVKRALKDAKNMASEHRNKFKLDYTENSLEFVDEILGDIYNNFQKTGDDSGVNGLSMIWGLYIGAVINSEFGRGSFKNENNGLNGIWPFYIDNIVVSPVEWCNKRMLLGEDENVYFKYKVLKKSLNKNK